MITEETTLEGTTMIPYPMLVLIVALGLFAVTIISFSVERLSPYYVPIAIVSSVVVVLVYIPLLDSDTDPQQQITGFIEFRALIFIFSMQIIVSIVEKERVFQFLAIHLIRLTRGNARLLFYVFCIMTTFFAAIIADVTVSIIFAPLIIRICRILDINPSPYLYGMTININLGSLITPFSSSENIIISTAFNLDLTFFLKNLWLFFFIALTITMFLIDLTMVRGKQRVNKEQKEVLLKILTPSIAVDKSSEGRFRLNVVMTIVVFSMIIMLPDSFIGALIGAFLLMLANRKQFPEIVKQVEWEIIFFFTALFIMIGVLSTDAVGFLAAISSGFLFITGDNGLLTVFLIFIITSLMSAFISNAPITLVFIPIVSSLTSQPAFQNLFVPMVAALLLGINLGGNFLPQGAACDIMTLTIAKRHDLKDFTYKSLFKIGGAFALLHFLLSMLFLLVTVLGITA